MSDFQLQFDSGNGTTQVPARKGEVVLIAGPNGVGKSALLALFYRSLALGTASYLPGHRQINFNSGSDSLSQSLLDIQRNLYQHIDAFSRYKNAWAEDHFRSIIRLLNNLESAYNREFRKSVEAGLADPRQQASLKRSPVDTLNVIFEAARLPIRFDATGDGIGAIRGTSRYRIDALSDGERAALFIAGAIITQAPDTVLLIDEPEKHLHPSVSAPFVQAAVRSRDDICIIMASHDVSILDKVDFSRMIYVQDSTVVTETPEFRTFRAHIIESSSEIPNELRIDILGTRSDMLFIEGISDSYDFALYSHIYKSVKIIPKGGCEKVIEGVRALRSSSAQHWVSPSGLIDGDGREEGERQKLAEDGIHCLPYPTIENLFFLDEAISCFISADRSFNGGLSEAERLDNLVKQIASEAKRAKADIVSRRASWLVQRELNAHKLSPRDIKDGKVEEISVSVKDLITRVEIGFDEIVDRGNWREILTYLPIKSTKLPNIAAKLLGAISYEAYQNVIIRQLDIRTPGGIEFISRLQRLLPNLNGNDVASTVTARSALEGDNVVAFPMPNRT